MFRWLTDQYPSVNRQLNEGLTPDVVVDNFYLDMNGIIHPCTHGNSDKVVILDETEMFKRIFSYVDRLYKLVRPRNVLYLAVDGVAPRAKMNQQRSRRFRSAKDAEVALANYVAEHGGLPDDGGLRRFDSNCITPGTDFMLKLGLALERWIAFKQDSDPFWKRGAKVILSGPDVPGEGEHKVMDYVRETQRANGGEPTGLRHVLYGLDADLIMLGLVTHEPEFTLLREKMSVVMAGKGRNKRKKKDMLEYDRNDFELLELSLLRRMFQLQFRKFCGTDDDDGDVKLLDVPYDNDRIVDDFVFMCVLVGNDFLPHCPHLEIDSGALSLMLSTYVELLPEWGGYLTDKDRVHPDRLERFVHELALYEEEHFRRRGVEENEPGWGLATTDDEFYGTHHEKQDTPREVRVDPAVVGREETDSISNKSREDVASMGDLDPHAVKSYRDYYYAAKLNYRGDDVARSRRQTARDYLEGLHWVLRYYHHGCGAWSWYFPHLYAPLATDLVNLREFYEDEGDEHGFRALSFRLSAPFPPLGQLLSVLPPQSAGLLPAALGELMTDPRSPLAPFYPPDFETDANGKRQSWEAVTKIPFIRSDALTDALRDVLDRDDAESDADDDDERRALLSRAERRRNRLGAAKTFVPPEFGEKLRESDVPDFAKRRSYRGRSNNGGGRGGGGRGRTVNRRKLKPGPGRKRIAPRPADAKAAGGGIVLE